MHYNELREANRKQQLTIDDHAYEWEANVIPTLHSGFITGTSKDANRSIIQLMIYFADGEYMCRISDRESHEKAFLALTSLKDAFEEIENAIVGGKLKWTPDKISRNGSSAY